MIALVKKREKKKKKKKKNENRGIVDRDGIVKRERR